MDDCGPFQLAHQAFPPSMEVTRIVLRHAFPPLPASLFSVATPVWSAYIIPRTVLHLCQPKVMFCPRCEDIIRQFGQRDFGVTGRFCVIKLPNEITFGLQLDQPQKPFHPIFLKGGHNGCSRIVGTHLKIFPGAPPPQERTPSPI